MALIFHPPALAPYLSYVPTQGGASSYPGFFFSASKGTVENVGNTPTTSGTSVAALENLTGTNGNSFLDFADVELAPNTRIGGFEWISVLEDVRGISNSNPNFTSTMTEFSVSGTIIPEPSAALMLAIAFGLPLILRKRAPSR